MSRMILVLTWAMFGCSASAPPEGPNETENVVALSAVAEMSHDAAEQKDARREPQPPSRMRAPRHPLQQRDAGGGEFAHHAREYAS